mmetsp:Transcript_8306/g.23908  ORF Transcript_8306/g.23908 Transcript_8306/m.23908 type:complete len:220 (-) Transcript_8306:1997-2656(-)
MIVMKLLSAARTKTRRRPPFIIMARQPGNWSSSPWAWARSSCQPMSCKPNRNRPITVAESVTLTPKYWQEEPFDGSCHWRFSQIIDAADRENPIWRLQQLSSSRRHRKHNPRPHPRRAASSSIIMLRTTQTEEMIWRRTSTIIGIHAAFFLPLRMSTIFLSRTTSMSTALRPAQQQKSFQQQATVHNHQHPRPPPAITSYGTMSLCTCTRALRRVAMPP